VGSGMQITQHLGPMPAARILLRIQPMHPFSTAVSWRAARLSMGDK
jgi:hypothetical protein